MKPGYVTTCIIRSVTNAVFISEYLCTDQHTRGLGETNVLSDRLLAVDDCQLAVFHSNSVDWLAIFLTHARTHQRRETGRRPDKRVSRDAEFILRHRDVTSHSPPPTC